MPLEATDDVLERLGIDPVRAGLKPGLFGWILP